MDNTSNEKICSNCGTPNNQDSVFCINCGNSFNTPSEVTPEPVNQPVIEQSVQEAKPKKKKKSKGCLIALIIILLIAGLIVGGIFLFKKLTFFEDPFVDSDIQVSNDIVVVSEDTSLTYALEQDYASGVINTDKYLSQLAYAIYEPSKLNQKYASLINDYDNPRDLFEIFFEKYNELSKETTIYIYKKYALNDVEWVVPEKETSNEPSIKYVTDNDGKVNKLDHVILSSKGNFLVYYTNDGINGVTDEYAKTLAKHLEKTVKEYKSLYGLDFKYDGNIQLFAPYSDAKAAILLEMNGIDLSYMNTALPVYILNLDFDGAEALAYYAGFNDPAILLTGNFAIWAEGIDLEADPTLKFQVDSLFSTYSVPYIVMTSDMSDIDSTKLISSHELFHHYQHYICGHGEYKECASGKFTIETTANFASVEANDDIKALGTALNKHAVYYAQSMESPVNSVFFQGYLSYVFASNYAEIVPNGTKKLFNSMKHEDALKHLYNTSEGKYKKVILQTAERALTLDYKNKQLLPYYENSWSPTFPKNHDIITANHSSIESMFYSSMDYYYIDLNNTGFYSDNTTVTFSGDSDDLTLLLFTYENGIYKKVYTHNLSEEFVIKQSDWKDYEKIVITIVDTAVSGTNTYTWTSSETSDKKPTVTPTSLGLKKSNTKTKKGFTTSKIVCSQVEDLDYIKSTYQVMVSFNNKDEVNDLYVKGTVEMEDNYAFKIAKGVTTGAVFLLKQKYKEQFGKITLRTYDEGNKYIILGRVKKDYYTAIKNSFNTDDMTREGIFKAIEDKGFTCEYR